MERRFFREYGLIVVVSLVGLTSAIYYRSADRVRLDVVLDRIGTRLLTAVEDPAGRQSVSTLFEAFKARVLNREVSPEQVELLAVNVLNLNSSGETVSAQEAADVLSMALEISVSPTAEVPARARADLDSQRTSDQLAASGADASSPAAPAVKEEPGETLEMVVSTYPPALARAPAAPVPPQVLKRLGRKLNVLLEFEETLEKPGSRGAPGEVLLPHLAVLTENGARVVLDARIRHNIDAAVDRDVRRMVKQLESEELIEWQENIASHQREKQRRDLEALERVGALERALEHRDAHAQRMLEQLERYRMLEAKGVVVPFDLDSLQRHTERRFLENVDITTAPAGG